MVPSLYVRVYRGEFSGNYEEISSLTIREGISIAEAEEQAEKPFPHYT